MIPAPPQRGVQRPARDPKIRDRLQDPTTILRRDLRHRRLVRRAAGLTRSLDGVGSKNARRRKRQNQRARRTGSVPVTGDNVDDLPRPLRLIIEGADRLGGFVRDVGADPMSLLAAIRSSTHESAVSAVSAAMPYDVFDVLAGVLLSQVPTNPDTYRETEHEGSVALVEFAATLLAARGTRDGTEELTGAARPRPDGAMEEIIRRCREAIESGSLLPMIAASVEAERSAAVPLELGAILRDLFVRNVAYPHMVEDTLRKLFGPADIESDCRSVLGVTADEAQSILRAIGQSFEDEWNSRLGTLFDFTVLVREEMLKAKSAGDSYTLSNEVRDRTTSLWDAAWDNLGDVARIDVADVAARTGLDVATVKVVIDLFAFPMQLRETDEVVDEFFAGRSPFRRRPLLSDPSGDAMLINSAGLIESVRDRFEEELKPHAAAWDRYSRHRGDFVEAEALRLLSGCLPTDALYSGFQYFFPDPTRDPVEHEPAKYTRIGECDGLIVVDDVALVVEAKAGALSAAARAGDAKRLSQDLGKIVTDASQQADRVRERVLKDQGLMLRDRSWIDLSRIREIHSVTVSLEDLSGVATITSELVRNGILRVADLPWTVSLHDLRIVTELVDRPPELLLYLRRRTNPDVTRRFHAVDELDFFLEFCHSGLYVEPDPDRLRRELPQFGEPTVAAKRRYASQGLEMLTSRTDQLDAWYFYATGVRDTPVPKPRLNSNRELQRLIDAVIARRSPGWLRLSTTLLDGSSATQRAFAQHGSKLMNLTRADGMPHTLAVLGGSCAADSFVLIWMSRGREQSRKAAVEHLTRYVSAKKHQAQVALGVGMLFDSASDAVQPEHIAYDSRPAGPDATLDAEVEIARLKPLEVSQRTTTMPSTKRSKRVTAPKSRR